MKLSYLWIIPVIIGLLTCTEPSPPKPKTTVKVESSIEKLGRHLYFDKRLSADNTVSCNSCHDVTRKQGGTDGRPTSVGIGGQTGGRNAPTVWNAKFLSVQFWDGRAKDLAAQAKGPITNPIEMGMKDHATVIQKISQIELYQKLFKQAFPEKLQPITIDNLAEAIAAFEEGFEVANSAFDRYQNGQKQALSEKAHRGYKSFMQVGCTSCHSGPHFSGPTLADGTGFFMKFPTFKGSHYEKKYDLVSDLGRFESTKQPADKNLWRVPSLRNVAVTAPYFHNGRVTELTEAIRIMGRVQLNRVLTDEQVSDIAAFLNSLTSELPEIQSPF